MENFMKTLKRKLENGEELNVRAGMGSYYRLYKFHDHYRVEANLEDTFTDVDQAIAFFLLNIGLWKS